MAPGGARRLLLASVALGAAALYQLFWLLPLALLLFLPTLWWGHAFLLGLAGAAFLLLVWVLQPRAAAPPRELRAEDAPDLHARVHALADALQSPRVHAIALDDELNAGALELNRGVSLRPARRVLILGRPLLAALDTEAVEAVIAHELGHFSRRHGRLGHWIYNTRQSWLALSQLNRETDADSSSWERAGAAFAQGFLPWFDGLAMPYLRRCEFEADALAARCVSPVALARALVLLERLHGPCARVQATVMRRLMLAHGEPPADLMVQQLAMWRSAADAMPPMAEPVDSQATHPPLAQRLAALHVTAESWPWPRVSAGTVWFGDAWPAVSSEEADPVAATQRWGMAHRLLRVLAQATSDAGESAAWRLHRAQVLGLTAPVAVDDATPQAKLLRARFELEAGRDAAALNLLLAAREPKTAARDVATIWLVEARLAADAEQARRHEAWLKAVRVRREAALEEMAVARDQGDIGAAPLSAVALEGLAAAWRGHPVVREVWLFGQQVSVQHVDYDAAVLLLSVDPAQLVSWGIDEDSLTTWAHELLRWVLVPGQLGLVLSRYTTEQGIAPALAQALAARPDLRLI